MRPIDKHAFGNRLAIERYRLDNGLTVLLVADPSAPVISYQTWFAVGSRHETEGKTGIAHLFEHLMFNETENLPYGAYDRRLEEVGAENNAATYLDWTYYLINLPKDALPLAVELEAERMRNLVLRDEQVESEREVVANERRETVDDDLEGSVAEELFSLAFERHSYRHPTIGRMQDIEALTTADCRAFYDAYYAPNNATVVVAGDTTPGELLPLIEAHYGTIARGSLPEERTQPEPVQTAERRVVLHKPTESPRLLVAYKSPAMGHPDHIALTLLSEVLFSGRGSRAFRALVEEREVASEVSAYVGNFRDPSLWEMHLTGTEDRTTEDLAEAFDAVIADALTRPVTDDELVRACHRLELSALQELETAAGKAESVGFSEVVLGDPAAQLSRLDAYRGVTPNDVAEVAERTLQVDRRTVAVVEPAD